MDVFYFPKYRHKRTQNPRKFKKYQTYKKFLQIEFERVCVYCRQPDTSAPNLNFGVDHYRPKSKFPDLSCVYENLYYCCGTCNTYKSNYWPLIESSSRYIVNPCDFNMSEHLVFDKSSGVVNHKTDSGKFMVEALGLNTPDVVGYRLNTLMIVGRFRSELATAQAQRSRLQTAMRNGKLSEDVFRERIGMVENRIADVRRLLDDQTGTKPVPAIPQARLGVSLRA